MGIFKENCFAEQFHSLDAWEKRGIKELCGRKMQKTLKQKCRETMYMDTTVETGAHRVKKIREILDSFMYSGQPLVRSSNQRICHDQMIRAVLPKLFTGEPDSAVEDALAYYGWKDVAPFVQIIGPRRFGKTWLLAMFILAYALVAPNSEQAVYSVALSSGERLLEKVKRFWNELPDRFKDGFTIDRDTKTEGFTLKGPFGVNDLRKICIYPSNADIRSQYDLHLQRPTPSRDHTDDSHSYTHTLHMHLIVDFFLLTHLFFLYYYFMSLRNHQACIFLLLCCL